MTENKLRDRLYFRSWHRGTREMDLLLGTFADIHIRDLSDSELLEYERILDANDTDLYEWIMGTKPVPTTFKNPVVDMILRHRFTDTVKN